MASKTSSSGRSGTEVSFQCRSVVATSISPQSLLFPFLFSLPDCRSVVHCLPSLSLTSRSEQVPALVTQDLGKQRDDLLHISVIHSPRRSWKTLRQCYQYSEMCYSLVNSSLSLWTIHDLSKWFAKHIGPSKYFVQTEVFKCRCCASHLHNL